MEGVYFSGRAVWAYRMAHGLVKVWQIERYHFAEHPPGIPYDLPTLDVMLDRFGHPQYLIQEWRYSSQRTLVVRRVESVIP